MQRIKIMKPVVLIFLMSFGCSHFSYAQNLALTSQSNVGFEIKSMGLSWVKGKFKKFQSKMDFKSKFPNQASIYLVMDVDSLIVNKSSLKDKIMSQDLFYVAKYKTITFQSTHIKPLGQDKYDIQGQLTIRGITRAVVFDTALKQNVSNPKILDMYAVTHINRTDFGMKKGIGGTGEKVSIIVSGQWVEN